MAVKPALGGIRIMANMEQIIFNLPSRGICDKAPASGVDPDSGSRSGMNLKWISIIGMIPAANASNR